MRPQPGLVGPVVVRRDHEHGVDAEFARAARQLGGVGVSLDPVPAITVAESPTSSIAASIRRTFSSSESVADSPVVPATTSP